MTFQSRKLQNSTFSRFREPFSPFRPPPCLPQGGSPRFQNTSFFKLNLSDRAETIRIDAAGELINVADYEHDPSTLSDFSVSEKLV